MIYDILALKRFPILFFLILCAKISIACDCETKQQLEISDWNDTHIILVADLLFFKKNFHATILKFNVDKVYKGKYPKNELDIFISKEKSHKILHNISNPKMGDKWVLFLQVETKNDKTFFRLTESKNSDFCALSRPLIGKDAYLHYLKDIKKSSKGYQKYYNEAQILIAEGNYRKGQPTGKWEYHNPNTKTSLIGYYKNGGKDGVWEVTGLNFKQELVTLESQIYEAGILTKIKRFNYIGELKSKTFFHEDYKLVYMYHKNILRQEITKTYDNKILAFKKYNKKGEVIKQGVLDRDSNSFLRSK